MQRGSDFLLTTRLDVLETNLALVAKTVTAMQDWRQDVSSLKSAVGTGRDLALEVTETMTTVRAKLKTAEQKLEPNARAKVTDALRVLDGADALMRELTMEIDTANGRVASIDHRTVPIGKDSEIGKTLQAAVQDVASEPIDRIGVIRDKLSSADQARKEAKAATADLLLAEAWSEYTALSEMSFPVFEEYVDLLRGLALRDVGFDQGICQTADALIRQWRSALNVKWDSLTIPSHREPSAVTLTRMLRLGFPEWTIWSIPLVAYEFGSVVAHQDPQIERLIEKFSNRGDPQHFGRSYAADAIATYAMGPAYACAAIVLRLSPVAAYSARDDIAAHGNRARVIFKMLELMNEKDGKRPYENILQDLKRQWVAALRQAHPRGTRTGAGRRVVLQGVESLWKHLNKQRGPIYTGQEWTAIQEWPEKLSNNDVDSIVVDGSEGFLAVLNAAWLCRITLDVAPDSVAQAAGRLWKRIDNQSNAPKTRNPDFLANREAPRPPLDDIQ